MAVAMVIGWSGEAEAAQPDPGAVVVEPVEAPAPAPAPVETPPVETPPAPVEAPSAPVEGAPVEAAPVEAPSAPVEGAPVEAAPVEVQPITLQRLTLQPIAEPDPATVVGSSTAVDTTVIVTEPPEREHKVLTGALEAGIFAARQSDQDVVSVSPLLTMGMRARPEVELGIRFGAAMMFADSRIDGRVRVVRPSNLMFGTRWVRDGLDRSHHGHIGFAFALPTNFRLDERETEALHYAVGVRGGLDPWQWAPTTLGIVLPGGWSWRGQWVQVGADAAIAALIAAASNPARPGFAAQVRGHVAFASPWVLAGAALSGVVNTRDTRDVTQAAVGPFLDLPMCFGKNRRPTCPFAITGQATVNLDAPFGFAGDGLRVWGAQAGLRWALWEPA